VDVVFAVPVFLAGAAVCAVTATEEHTKIAIGK
jgi:hypothetical protein